MDIISSGAGNSQDYTQVYCPACKAEGNQFSQYQIVFSGPTGLAYQAEILYANQSISVGQTARFTVTNTAASTVFRFEAPEDVTSSQLEITATSDSSVSAYLTVSLKFKNALKHKVGQFGTTTNSLRLSFSKKGRITLSHSSSPKLKGGQTWYIGVALKHSDSVSKNITLSLTKGFNYDYTNAMCFLVFTSLAGGIIVSIWALYCFREPLLLVRGDSQFSESVLSMTESLKSILRSCWVRSHAEDERSPLLPRDKEETSLSLADIMRGMWTVLRHHWLGRGAKTFSYTTCIVGFVLLVGAFQFVYGNWHSMVESGDRDQCYYNDFCYQVSGSDIPFNLMISNLAYMIHGFILAWSVWVMEAELWAWSKQLAEANRFQDLRVPFGHEKIPKHMLKCQNFAVHVPWMAVPKLAPSDNTHVIFAQAHKKRVSYSIGYAFAWALVFEGLFSLLYHFCPSRLTFQFDSAFMFVIAGLIVLSLFNGFSVKPHCEHDIATPIEAGNFFLFVIVPLYIFNYLGSLYSMNTTYTLNHVVRVLFVVCLCIWYVLIFTWAGRKLFYPIRSCGHFLSNSKGRIKAVFFVITIGVTCVLLPILMKHDLPDLFLFSCISASLISLTGKVITVLCQSKPSKWTFKKLMFRAFQTLYVLVTLGVMAVAVWVFEYLPTTDKTISPEKSRALNEECVLLGFFDYHDLWHILSSFALLMGAYLVMYVSE